VHAAPSRPDLVLGCPPYGQAPELTACCTSVAPRHLTTLALAKPEAKRRVRHYRCWTSLHNPLLCYRANPSTKPSCHGQQLGNAYAIISDSRVSYRASPLWAQRSVQLACILNQDETHITTGRYTYRVPGLLQPSQSSSTKPYPASRRPILTHHNL
jgi:hypothetical protein